LDSKKLKSALQGIIEKDMVFGAPGSQWKHLILIKAENFTEVMGTLRQEESFCFDHLECITCHEEEKKLVLSWFLESTRDHEKMIVRVKMPLDKECEIPTALPLWPAAEGFENEIEILFGVAFSGRAKSNLSGVRFEPIVSGYPLRKNFIYPSGKDQSQ